ncbi:MAG: response regulator [Bryobacterales bacterium]|nr:response regulator [Bryobacterales bacterium]
MTPHDPSLLAIYSTEQAEHVAAIRGQLDGLRRADAAAVDELLRRLHTLKGAARAVGLEPTEMLAHQAEDVLTRFRSLGTAAPGEAAANGLLRMADTAEDVLAAAMSGRAMPDVGEVLRQLTELARGAVPLPPSPVLPPPPEPDRGPAPELLRVQAGNLDELIRTTSDLLLDTVGFASRERFAAYEAHLEEAASEWVRLRRASGEAVRELAEHPEFQVVRTCLAFMDGRIAVLRREARRVSEELVQASLALRAKTAAAYQAASRIRMTPAESVFGVFGPMVRDLARQEGREVVFEAVGLQWNADLLVLQRLKDPVMHLLRNAVSHGVEPPDVRLRKGKPPAGTVRLVLECLGDRLELAIEDDGAGIDVRTVEQEARARGLLGADESIEEAEQLTRLLLHAGFSTSKAVTGVSGRGVGLAVVALAIQRLHGGMELMPLAGGGTRVAISVPLSISSQQVLLVAVGTHCFAIPAAHVETVLHVKPEEVRNADGRESVATAMGAVMLYGLGTLLGVAAEGREEGELLSCAVLCWSGRRLAVVVDRLVDVKAVLIKDSGLRDADAGMTAGAIPLEDGGVAPVLNVSVLFETAGRTRRGPSAAEAPVRKTHRKPRILVVDDSLTTRSLEKNILEANGYEVRLAVDGLEAWELLRAEIPDLVISDVSMPRMTGFELLEQMKKTTRLRTVPFILVTSLESQEEQRMGLSLGADAYIVKRKFDARELLTVIQEIL